MATSGKDTGMVGYNVQAVVDAKHHLIVAPSTATSIDPETRRKFRLGAAPEGR